MKVNSTQYGLIEVVVVMVAHLKEYLSALLWLGDTATLMVETY
nr:MAG TPA: hypothetical protein [Caudoviricetes sp.]